MPRPTPFTFEFDPAPEAQRIHRKQRLAAGFRLFGRFGFDEGVAGHITARDPERDDHFWVNPFGMSFRQIRASDLILVDHSGEVVEGEWPVNRAAFAIHASVHAARPGVVAAAHSHSKWGRALSTLGQRLEPLTQDSCAFFEDHEVFDDYTGVVDDPEEGKKLAAALGDSKAVILANHGLLTVGDTVESALWWYITLERSAEVQINALAAGTPRSISPEVARATREQIGGEGAGIFQFQPLWNWIVEQEPDLLD